MIDDVTIRILEEEAARIDDVLVESASSVRIHELADWRVGLQSRPWIADPSRTDFVRVRSTYLQRVRDRFHGGDIDAAVVVATAPVPIRLAARAEPGSVPVRRPGYSASRRRLERVGYRKLANRAEFDVAYALRGGLLRVLGRRLDLIPRRLERHGVYYQIFIKSSFKRRKELSGSP